MCNRLSLLALLFISQLAWSLPADPWALPAWNARIHLTNFTIASASGSLNNFPVLVRLTNCTLLNQARSDGGDLTFVDPNGAQLFHEIESFNRSTGDLLAWVCVPTLSNQTRFYLYYSNTSGTMAFSGSNTYASLSTSLPSLATNTISTNTWDTNFRLVLHFNETSGTPKDSSRYSLSPASVGISNRPGTNGAIGLALATSLPTKNNLSNATPVFYTTNGFAPSPLQVSYSMWAMFNSPAPAYVGSNQFMQLLSYFGGGSSTGVLCLRFDSNNGTTHTTYNGSVATSKVTNFDQWNFFAGGGTLVNYVVGSPTNGTNFFITNGFLAKTNTTLVAMISNNSPGSGLSLGGYPNVNYHPSGGFDEFRLSHTNREATWLITEYSNAVKSPNSFLADGPEYAVNPTLALPAGLTNTNMSMTFQWVTGNYGAPLDYYTLSIMSNGVSWLNANLGTNLSTNINLASVFGPVSTTPLTWWVTATTTTPGSFSSVTNTFVAALAQRARVQGLVYDSLTNALTNVVVQSTGLPGSYLLTDSSGRFDLGALIVNQVVQVTLTPPGRYGLLPLVSNFNLGQSDVTLTFVLTNGQGPNQVVTFRTNAPIFIGVSGGVLRLKVPLTWSDNRRVQVYAQNLSGGRKIKIFEGLASAGQDTLEISAGTLKSLISSGPYVLEYRLTGPGGDESSALVGRQLFFYAQ